MENLKISVLNVGHGDFIYAETPLGDNLIIDCGSGDVIPSDLLKQIDKISEFQISHPHTDHFDDIIQISKKEISSFRCPLPYNFTDEMIGWKNGDKDKILKLRELKKLINPDNSAVRVGSGFNHTVWSPDEISFKDPNSSSLVTILEYNGFKMLFGGDLPSSGWESLLQNNNFVNKIESTNVLKVPHHGRDEGCCEALFEVITPELCIISDKAIEKDNKNTVATKWYSEQSKGCEVVDFKNKQKVLSTRAYGSIFISVNEIGSWSVHTNTEWIN